MSIDIVKQIAEANPDGFTIKLQTLEHIASGIIVAYAATQNSHNDEGLRLCIKHAQRHDGILGGWLNQENNTWYWDSCQVFTDRAAAIAFGKQENQIAIFDLDDLREIRL